ncbi:Plastid lipid-associated protein/fibrillin conserved domain-containing protein [Dioscorea alata]|uniref:Plastid lipid-associated protein/fibrillin conserved domain-containing protein n=1 Tax=Dioscorea alata TaxID=55571 RepID=A0ACB7VEN0_DIOAL|nr:Plastid lipid-associated protein/fibrillin conserved domain-containing protein [Dioscorea alata]
MSSSTTFNALTFRPIPAVSPAGSRRLSPAFLSSSSSSSKILTLKSGSKPALSFRLRAVADDDEWGREEPSSNVAVAEVNTEVVELKQKLRDLLYGTDRGLKASSETRAEIVELITQLEAKNPTPAPTDALSLLNGKWILAYTSFSQLFPLLGSGRLPELVKVEEISQTIDSEAFTVQNSVKFAGPLATTSVTTNAKFEVRSPKRVQVLLFLLLSFSDVPVKLVKALGFVHVLQGRPRKQLQYLVLGETVN